MIFRKERTIKIGSFSPFHNKGYLKKVMNLNKHTKNLKEYYPNLNQVQEANFCFWGKEDRN